jgi:hypothetical protein
MPKLEECIVVVDPSVIEDGGDIGEAILFVGKDPVAADAADAAIRGWAEVIAEDDDDDSPASVKRIIQRAEKIKVPYWRA